MHFPIIQLLDEPLNEDNAMKESWLAEDEDVLDESDYLSGPYDAEARKKEIGTYLPKLFEGIATVDPEKEVITFLDRETISATLRKDVLGTLADLTDYAKTAPVDRIWYRIRCAGNRFRESRAIFFHHFGETSGRFFENAADHAGKTLYIGTIISAHC